jgi:hypothetical protein
MAPTRDQAMTPSWATLSLGCQACSVEANLHWRRQVMRNAMWVKENLQEAGPQNPTETPPARLLHHSVMPPPAVGTMERAKWLLLVDERIATTL